jgi:two-component system sensor histidine kinase DegS
MGNPKQNQLTVIEERVNRLVQDSLDELYTLRREDAENLDRVRARSRDLSLELRNLAASVDKALKKYDRLRAALLESAKTGNAAEEKSLYDKAAEAMAARNALTERHRLLSAQKSEMIAEERRLERSVARGDSMGNRLRMVMNLMTAPEDLLGTDSTSVSAETMSAAFQLVEWEAAAFTRELHDGPTQTFSAVNLMLEMAKTFMERNDSESALEEIGHAAEQTRNGLGELRALLFSLSPTGIQDGFETPLKRLAAQMRQMRGCSLTYTLSGDFSGIPVNTKIGAFKTLHQAVLNAALHGATEVKASVRHSKKALEVRVTDNGRGFDVDQEREAVKERGSYGLRNMEERVRMLGGKLVITSALKKGSSVAFSIPVFSVHVRYDSPGPPDGGRPRQSAPK